MKLVSVLLGVCGESDCAVLTVLVCLIMRVDYAWKNASILLLKIRRNQEKWEHKHLLCRRRQPMTMASWVGCESNPRSSHRRRTSSQRMPPTQTGDSPKRFLFHSHRGASVVRMVGSYISFLRVGFPLPTSNRDRCNPQPTSVFRARSPSISAPQHP